MPRAGARASVFAIPAAAWLALAAACGGEDGARADARDAGADAPEAGALPSRSDAPRDAAARADVLELGGDARPGDGVATVHVVGRVDDRDPAGPRFGWPGVQIRTRFSGSTLSLQLADSGLSHYDVEIDGAAPVLLEVSGPLRTYVIADGLPHGTHDVVLTKRTETFLGVTQLLGVAPGPGGALVPTPAPSGRRIEIVGDSITCGFGVLGLDQTCPFSADTESEPLAWGALAAKSLGALRMVTAWSGLGVLRNYAGDTTPTMPERYGRALADDETSVWAHAFVPDAIVVALGTNDFAGGQGDPGPEFQASYTTFLATLRSVHPGAHLVAATSPMLSGGSREKLHLYLEGAVAARKAAGDARVSLLEIDEQSEEDGYGCGYHPSRTTQQKMAARLVGHLKVHLGW